MSPDSSLFRDLGPEKFKFKGAFNEWVWFPGGVYYAVDEVEDILEFMKQELKSS